MAFATTNSEQVVSMERRVLTVRRLASSAKLGSFVRESLDLSMHEDQLFNAMVYNLSAQVLSDKIADDRYSAYFYWKEPATWFDHWKKDKAPTWFKKRWPVNYVDKKAKRTVHFTRWAQYPKANVALQRNRNFYEVTLGGFESLWDEVTS